MTTARRIGAEDSATRAALLDAAQALMMEEGYAAVTSRKVAARAALQPPHVHYSSRTMDELFVALVRPGADEARQRQDAALASDQPLWSLWETTTHPAGRTVITEIAALANHRKALRTEIAALAQALRDEQIAALTPILAGYGVTDTIGPEAFATLLNALGQNLVMEEALGLDTGHTAIRALVEGVLTRHEGPRR